MTTESTRSSPLAPDQGYASGIVVDDANVYWVDQSSSGSVMQVAR
jgi:hypothetical protein